MLKRSSILSRLTFLGSPQRLVHSPRARRADMLRVAGVLLLGVVVSTAAVAPHHPSSSHSRTALGMVRSTADTAPAADSQISGFYALPSLPVQWTPWNSTGWSGRVVIGEDANGVFCAACWYHDRAFEALLQRYPPTAFIALGYPGSDPTGGGDWVDSLWSRFGTTSGGWYSIANVTHGIFPQDRGKSEDWIDGHATQDNSDNANELTPEWVRTISQKYYAEMVSAIDAELHKAPEAVLHVQATPHGGAIDTRVTVTSLAPGHPDVYVRICLVEDTVHLHMAGHHGQLRNDYYMVVRMAAGSTQYPLGIPLHGPGTVRYSFELAWKQIHMLDLRRFLMEDPHEDLGGHTKIFPDIQDWRVNPTRLQVVAFVQDARTGDVLQAQMVPVKTGPHGALLQLP